MATVIDSLVLELGLDTSQFSREQREAVDSLRNFEVESSKVGRNVEREGKSILGTLSSVKTQLVGAVAGVLGLWGVEKLISGLTQVDAAVGRSAKTLNLSGRELAAWQSANAQAGGSAAAMTSALQGTTDALENFRLTGQGSFLPVLNRLGVRLFDQNHQLRTSTQLYLDLASAVEKMHDPARARAFLQLVPGLNDQTINLLLLGRKAVEAYVQAGRENNSVTEESIRVSQEYNRQTELLGESATSTWRTFAVGTGIITGLTSALEALLGWFNRIRDHPLMSDLAPGEGERGRDPAGMGLGIGTGTIRDFLFPRPEDNWTNRLFGNGAPAQASPSTGAIAGIPVKPGAGRASPQVRQALDALAGLAGLSQVTSMDDDFHRRFGTGGHPLGNAVDVTIADRASSPAMAAAIRDRLRAAGINATVLDEYRNPSGHATGGHIHIGIVPPPLNAGAPAAAAAATSNTTTNRGGDTVTNSVQTGDIHVHAPGADAGGIARGIGGEIGAIAAPLNLGLR